MRFGDVVVDVGDTVVGDVMMTLVEGYSRCGLWEMVNTCLPCCVHVTMKTVRALMI